MKKSLYMLAIAGAITVAGGVSSSVSAATTQHNTNTPNCNVSVIGKTNTVGKSDSRFTYDPATRVVSTKVVVKGDADCTKDVSIASWRAPYDSEDFRPYRDQTLVDSKSVNLGVGTHTLSVNTDDCLYQVDLLYGKETTVDGTADYPDSQKLGWVQSGTKICRKPVVVTPPAPETPVETPAAPVETPVAAVEEPETLPEVGTGGLAAVFGVTATVAACLHRMVTRRLNAAR